MKGILLLLFLAPLFLHAQITSTFDIDADGWTFTSVSTSIPVTHQASGGGYVSVTYSSNASATVQNWIAPTKFRGNQLVRSLGMQLKFDLQQSQAGTGAGFDVLIRNGGSFIYMSGITPKPAVAPGWTSYSFTLDETGGWFHSPGAVAATRAQIKSILANVTSIEIRGTYATNAAYTSGLDNVILEQRALAIAPIATSLSVSSGKPGDVITISGSGFDATPANNSIWFGAFAGTKAVVQSATSTQLTVVVPQGAVYGPITITNTVTGLSTKTLTPFNPVFDGGGRIIPASFHNRFTISTIPIEGWFVGDVDGDGWEDFAVTNNNTEDAIDIYRNLALGGDLSTASFAAKVTVPMPPLGGSGANGTGLWFVDLDGDAKLDMVSSTHTSAFSAAFVTFRNISTPGNITFAAPEYWAGGSDETPISLVADLDGDGRPEIMAGEGAQCGCVRTDFWFNQNISTPGNIEFSSAIGLYNNSVINGFAGSVSGDLNGDGKVELIISNAFGATVLQNTSTPGVPSFLNSFTINTGNFTMRVVDVNLDGKNDLVWKSSSSVYIRINTDTDGILTGTDFATEFILTSDLGTGGGITIVDFNGDGKPDIASTDISDVGVYENVFSGGAFSANAYIPAYQVLGTGGNSSGAAVVDFNRDGKPDFAMATGSYITIIQNKNVVGPQISVNTVSPLSAPVGATVTITGNNFSTIISENEVYFGAVKATILTATATVITASVPPGATYAPVSVRRGELTSRYRLPFTTTFSPGVTFDNTHFAPPVNFTLTNANYDIEVGDLNRDGKPDLLAEANGGFVFRNTHSSGAISVASLLPDDTLSVNSFINPRLEDFDGDGFLDVASVNGLAHRNISTPTEISFQPSITIALGATTMDQADFNNDGKMDLTVTTDLSGLGDLLIKENRSIVGTFTTGAFGSFSDNIVFNKPAAGGGVVSEDFDGDGFADIATTNPLTDNISVYRNVGVLKVSTTQFASRTDLAVGDNPGRIYKGDFDADGKVDLLLYHGGTSSTLLTVFHNTSIVGNISFTRIDLTNPSTTTVATVADLDGDGKPEIITTSETGNRFSIFKNLHTSGALTTASFATPFNTTVTAPRGIATGDLNVDGKPEIIITRAAGLLVVYENLIPSASITVTQQPVTPINVCQGSNASLTTDATGAANITYQWQKFNNVTSLFENLANDATYTGSTTKTLSIAAVTNPQAGNYRCLIKGDFASDVTTNTATVVVNNPPSPPSVTPASRCDAGPLTLTATGGANGNYRWYTTASGGSAIAGETNGTLAVPSLAVTTTYYVSLADAFCESNRVAITATINTSPTAPIIAITGNTTFCNNQIVTLSAPSGFANYLWSTGAITQQITVNTTGTFTVEVTDAVGCSSPSSSGVSITVIDCSNNQPPTINTVPLAIPIEGQLTVELTALLSDPDNNLDLSTLKITSQPQSGALAQIDGNNNLQINYSGVSFSGTDRITIEVCDIVGSCTEQELQIEVIGDITVYNAVSPNGDGKNDILLLQYIDVLSDTRENKVSIYNRWGDLVFEIDNYDNRDRVFVGQSSNAKNLPTGVYYYKIEFKSRNTLKTGYLYLKR
jgi:gliding motility-associated-like protein